MAWVQVDQSLLTDKKTLKLKRALNINATYAMGIVTALWLWAIDNAPGGDLSDMDGYELADICDFPGEYGDEFLKAFIKSGFIISNEDKRVIADWDDLVGRLMMKREIKKEKDRERQRNYRQKKKAETEENFDDENENNECHTDITALSQACHTDVTACHTDVTACHTPLQYSTVEYSKVINNSDDSDSSTRARTREELVEDVKNVESYENEVSAEFRITYLQPGLRSEIIKLIRERASYYWRRDLTDYELNTIAEDLLSHHGGHVNDFNHITDDDEFLLTEAFKNSSMNDCKKVSYISGVYRNYRQRNIYSIGDYYNYADRIFKLVGNG